MKCLLFVMLRLVDCSSTVRRFVFYFRLFWGIILLEYGVCVLLLRL